jgi:uncharacterized membrane protein
MLRALLPRLLVCLFALVAAAGAWAQAGAGKAPDDPDASWRKLTPEQRVDAWKRMSPEQRQAVRQKLTPEQRDTIRQRMQERRENGELPGRRLSPEERRQLRDQIYESNRARPPHAGKNPR